MGIHGLIAAAAGAKRVYLVEPEPVVQIAREIAGANGLADRIVILEDRIEDVSLPEKVDLIISVFAGNLLYTEDLLPSLYYARDRYLKPGGHMVPDFAELILAPALAPDIHARQIGRWAEPSQGLDFSAGRRFAANEMLKLTREKKEANQLAPGAVLTSVDLMSASHADCLGESSSEIETSGSCHGLLGWIRIRLGDLWLSSDLAAPEVHWSPVLLPIDPPLPVQAGEVINFSLQRPSRGDWTWAINAKSGSRRHSSFLARTDGPRHLRRLSLDYRPGLNRKGEHALHALAMMKDGKSNREIAQELADADKKTFPSSDEALQLLKKLISHYAKSN